MNKLDKLRTFVTAMTRLIEQAGSDEAQILRDGQAAMKQLVAEDDWLPEAFTLPDPEYYQQYLLYCDPLERLSVVSFVWGTGQATPVHNHTVWGVIGMLRGSETCVNYNLPNAGSPMTETGVETLSPGEVTVVSPTVGDIHKVGNALEDRPSISIHAYGANIGAVSRHVFVTESGERKPFVSGYANTELPNIWDRSAEVRATLSNGTS
ncbi:MAG: cysteine dioxygenase [Rhodospirillales bacterium]|jgi:predicted metal-dependent enzyme (double-stranded beta helix superfamily)